MHSRSLELCQRWEWGHSTWVVAAHLNKEVLCDRAVWSEVRANDDALSMQVRWCAGVEWLGALPNKSPWTGNRHPLA